MIDVFFVVFAKIADVAREAGYMDVFSKVKTMGLIAVSSIAKLHDYSP